MVNKIGIIVLAVFLAGCAAQPAEEVEIVSYYQAETNKMSGTM